MPTYRVTRRVTVQQSVMVIAADENAALAYLNELPDPVIPEGEGWEYSNSTIEKVMD